MISHYTRLVCTTLEQFPFTGLLDLEKRDLPGSLHLSRHTQIIRALDADQATSEVLPYKKTLFEASKYL